MPTSYDDRSEWDLIYEGSFFPYLYDGKDGSLRGFIPIMWKIIGEVLQKAIRYHEISRFISHMLLSAAQALFLLSITLTTFYHGAYFRGDTIVTVPSRPSTLTQLITSLDRRYMLLDVPGRTTMAQRNLTNNNVQFQPDKALFFKQLCSDRNAFTFLFSGEKYQRTIINASCALSQVTLNSMERTTYKPFERMGIDSPYVITTPRNLTSRRLMKRINGIILKFFQDEQIVNLWNPRSVDSLRHYYDDEAKPTAEFNPMSLEQLSIVFFLFLGGASAAILLMLAEKIYHKFFHRHNLISSFKTRSSAIVQKYSLHDRVILYE
ncbi:hypothetical protein PRIPAC_79234 [Pristionchus pacificus]|uniref:Uncharacterized protein n=1 Tax=Pristionchus pacificus TaxID=54126 RepID=A0A454XTU4_PRIPA|nr:hypothetical protein PRIPAC_79234 [Pristionchus pacificus]|eukprot:PDM73036.1 hypothetical protein PRIPAC_39470 [Pristionchus pacificus]